MSQVLRLPRKMTMDTSDVLRLPGKLQLILRKRPIRPSRERLRTVVNGRENKRNVERTHPQPQTPRVKLEPLLRNSGKIIYLYFYFFTSHGA